MVKNPVTTNVSLWRRIEEAHHAINTRNFTYSVPRITLNNTESLQSGLKLYYLRSKCIYLNLFAVQSLLPFDNSLFYLGLNSTA